MSSYQYRKSLCWDKTVVRSSYLHNGISYTGKVSSLYWIRAQVATCQSRTHLVILMLLDYQEAQCWLYSQKRTCLASSGYQIFCKTFLKCNCLQNIVKSCGTLRMFQICVVLLNIFCLLLSLSHPTLHFSSNLLVCMIKWEPIIQLLENVVAIYINIFSTIVFKIFDIFFQVEHHQPYLWNGWSQCYELKRKKMVGYWVN